MTYFTINGKEYKAKEFDYNSLCDLEDMGVNLEQAKDKPMSMVRAYFGVCADMSKERAGKEIEQHIINGGKLDDLMKVMSKAMEESDFFRNLNKTEAKKTRKSKAETETVETEE